MSKSMLVIDTPNSCIKCPCHFSDSDRFWCGVNGKDIKAEDIESYKPEWCLLKAVEKKKAKEGQKRNVVDYGKIVALYKAGWTQKKIAEEMGVSANAISVALRRYKEKMESGYIWDADGKKFVGK